MRSSHDSPPDNKGCGKDTFKLSAKQLRVLQSWYKPATMRMVAQRAGIYNTTVCGYMSKFDQLGLLKTVKLDTCKVSTHKAVYYELSDQGRQVVRGLNYSTPL